MANIDFNKIIRGGKIANNTTSSFHPLGYIVIELHGNPIFKIRDGGFSFSLAGWASNTTRDRVNQLIRHFIGAGIYVHQKDWVQYLTINGETYGLDTRRWVDVDTNTGTLSLPDAAAGAIEISI